MHRERIPRLQPHVQESQLRMLEVEIVVEALHRGIAEVQLLLLAVAMNLVRAARLDAAQDADQSFLDPVGGDDGPRLVLLARGTAGQIDQGPPGALGQRLRPAADLLRCPLGVLLEGLQQHSPLPQVVHHAPRMGQQPQRAAKPQPIKPAERPHDRTRVAL